MLLVWVAVALAAVYFPLKDRVAIGHELSLIRPKCYMFGSLGSLQPFPGLNVQAFGNDSVLWF